jgi:hypothetical protein
MQDGCKNSKNTVVFSTHWRWRGTEVYVVAAGWPTMFTTNMVGAGRPETGVSATAACGVFAEDVTHLDTSERIEDE